MSMDFATLEELRRRHPAWRLLAADSAPLVASFLHRVFIAPNRRALPQAELVEALEDELFALRERFGAEAYPRAAADYLNDWAVDERAWLRKYYPQGSDEPHFDLTSATEKAIAWLDGLTQRSFVGTESRLLTLFDLLRQIAEGTETDVEVRIRELQRRRDEIDIELTRILSGDIPLLDDTAIRDRFQQFTQLARDLLGDFRQVEQNFRELDRSVRERIALWQGTKGALVQEILGERDHIADSDQGRSFRAFWDFLMSARRQEELTDLLSRVLRLPPVSSLAPDPRLRRVHYDWLEAGEHTQRTVAQLSQQLRRFLDDQAYLENRRIMDLLQGIEAAAVGVRDHAPAGDFTSIAETSADLELPMERPLYSRPAKAIIGDGAIETDAASFDAVALFDRIYVDKEALRHNVRQALQDRSQVTLRELLDTHPLEQGLAELVAYLQIAGEDPHTVFDDETGDQVRWRTSDEHWKVARLPRVIFMRGA
jgi:hypothetical protein